MWTFLSRLIYFTYDMIFRFSRRIFTYATGRLGGMEPKPAILPPSSKSPSPGINVKPEFVAVDIEGHDETVPLPSSSGGAGGGDVSEFSRIVVDNLKPKSYSGTVDVIPSSSVILNASSISQVLTRAKEQASVEESCKKIKIDLNAATETLKGQTSKLSDADIEIEPNSSFISQSTKVEASVDESCKKIKMDLNALIETSQSVISQTSDADIDIDPNSFISQSTMVEASVEESCKKIKIDSNTVTEIRQFQISRFYDDDDDVESNSSKSDATTVVAAAAYHKTQGEASENLEANAGGKQSQSQSQPKVGRAEREREKVKRKKMKKAKEEAEAAIEVEGQGQSGIIKDKKKPRSKRSKKNRVDKQGQSQSQEGGEDTTIPIPIPGGGGRPNFFVAFQVSDKDIKSKVQEIQENILAKEVTSPPVQKVSSNANIFKETMIPVDKLHFTLHVFHLKDEDDLQKAKTVLESCYLKVKDEFVNNPITIGIEGLGHFRNSVIFAKIQDESHISRLELLCDALRQEYNEVDIIGDSKVFKPHMTIAKMSRSKKLHKKKVRSFPPEIWSEFESQHFGYQRVESLQLLSMTDSDPQTGYYRCMAQYNFFESAVPIQLTESTLSSSPHPVAAQPGDLNPSEDYNKS